MRYIHIIALTLWVAPAWACDVLIIEDNGPNRAIITYTNNVKKCSDNVYTTLTTPNGISARVQVRVGDAEVITVEPSNQLFAYPPTADVLDGETIEIHIMGGLS